MDGFMHENDWAVNANWNSDSWNVKAFSVESPRGWHFDSQVFSRNS